MAVTATPIFVQAPWTKAVSIATANTNRDGTGTLGVVCTGGTNGSRIRRVVVQAAGTVTAGVVRLYAKIGGTYYLWKEVLIPATTPSTSVEAYRFVLDGPPGESLLDLASGDTLEAATNNAETFKVIAQGGDF